MQLENGENKKGSWTLNYLLGDSRFNGKLIITDQNVYYDINFAVGGAAGLGEADGALKISRSDIKKVEAFTVYWLFRRFRITLKDGKEYVFDRGMMPVGAIVDLLK